MGDPIRYSMIPQLVDNGIKRKQFEEVERINEWLPYAYIFSREWRHDGLRNYCVLLAGNNKFRLDPAVKYLFKYSNDKHSAYRVNRYITMYAVWNIWKDVSVSDKLKLTGLALFLNGYIGQHDDLIADINDIVTAYCFLTLIGYGDTEIASRLRDEANKILEVLDDGYEKDVAVWRLYGKIGKSLEPKHFINDIRLWIMSKEAYEHARRKI